MFYAQGLFWILVLFALGLGSNPARNKPSSPPDTPPIITLENADQVTELMTLEGHMRAYTPAWSPDGTLLAGGTQQGPIRLWEIASGTKRPILAAHVGWTRRVAWSPNGQLLASTGQDTLVQLWNPATGEERIALRDHRSPDGTRFALGSGDTSVRIWGIPPTDNANMEENK